MKYRAEVDGLRSLAILPVVLYHAFGSVLPGGFLGVDVFFVISGYLITALVTKDIQRQSFTLARFYERRARRILPALFAMIFTVLLVGLVALPPAHLEELGGSALSAALYVSNVVFWQSIGYFSTDSEFWPLLHTWSLSVEEQFYLVHPLLLLVILRFSSKSLQVAVLACSVVMSLGLCLVATGRHPSASFYLLPFRYWELATGALCAFVHVGATVDVRLRQTAAMLGVGLIVASMALFREGIPFPGYWAILPVLGSSLVIVFSPGTAVARFLSLRPLVFVGLISYSLYLWHWPVLAFARYLYGSPVLPVTVALVCVFVSGGIAYASWRWIETPFRRLDFLKPKNVAWLAGSISLAAVACGAALIASSGWPGRLDKNDLKVAAAIGDFRSSEACWGTLPSDESCVLGSSVRNPSILVWGDSHAGALIPAFDAALSEADQAAVVATRGACAPLIGVRRVGYGNDECVRFNEGVLEWLKTEGDGVERVILVARWNLNATGVRPPGEAGASVRLVHEDGSGSSKGQLGVFEYGLDETVRSLRDLGLDVLLLDDTPEVGWNVPMATFLRNRLALPHRSGPNRDDVRIRERVAHEVLLKVAERNDASFVSLNDQLCAPDCKLLHGGQPIYADDDHISSFGAKYVIAPLLIRSGVVGSHASR